MTTDLLFSIIIIAFAYYGLRRPYIALSGVIWIDIVRPQVLSFGFLAAQQLSLLMTGIFFLSFLVNLKKIKMPTIKLPLVFLGLLMLWITITTAKAHYHYLAVFKYEVAIKTMIFAAFVPFVLNSRKKIECVLWVFVASVGFFIIIAGAKTLLGGGGYSMSVVHSRAGNSGIEETSTLSAVTVAMVPLVFYLYRYSQIVQSNQYLKLYLAALSFASVCTIVGTYARTGLVAAAALVVMMFFTTQKKMRMVVIVLVGCLLIIPVLPVDWVNRMSTITEASEEGSALGRLVVWRWTLDYAAQHPLFGGGFYAYLDNRGKLQGYAKAGEYFETNEDGKAFHSIIFEMLGEQGYVGLMIYMLLIVASLMSLKAFLKMNDEDKAWLPYLAKMIIMASLVYLVGGLFISISFEPWLFYILFFGISLRNIPLEKPNMEVNEQITQERLGTCSI